MVNTITIMVRLVVSLGTINDTDHIVCNDDYYGNDNDDHDNYDNSIDHDDNHNNDDCDRCRSHNNK